MLAGAAILLGLAAVFLWWDDRQRARRRALVARLALAPAHTPLRTDRSLAPESGLLAKTALPGLLARAGISIPAASFAAAVAAASLASGLALAGFLDSPFLLPLVLAGGPVATLGWLRVRAAQRERAIQDRLPEAVDVLSRAVRAGQSMDAALREAGERVAGPLGVALRRLVEQLAVGVPFERATRAMAESHPGIAELQFLASTLILQRETGGNLAEVLERLAATLRERVVLRRDVQTATAEGRASATILALMPLAFAVGIALLRPDYVAPLFEDPAGRLLLVAALTLECVGFLAMRWLARVDA